jgi:hypothetical protein
MATAQGNDLGKMLKSAKKNWGDTVEAAKSSGMSEWDDGEYIGLFSGYEVKQSQGTKDNPPAWGVLLEHLILEGDRTNETKYEWISLFYEGEISSKVIKRLEALTGTDAADLDPEQLENLLDDAVSEKQVWKFRLKTKGEYQNLWLRERLEDYELPDEDKKGKSKTASSSQKPAAASSTSTSKSPAKAGTKANAKEKAVCPVEEGDTVTISVKGVETEGIVDSIDEDGETVTVKVGKKSYPVGYDEVEKTEEPASDFEEGDTVTFSKKVKGKDTEFEGVIHSIDGDDAQVKVGKTTHLVPLDELTKSEDETAEDAPFSEGDTVSFKVGKNEKEGEVVSVDADEEEITVSVNGKEYTVAFDDAEKIEDNDNNASGDNGDNITIEIGDEVSFEQDGKEFTGECTAVDNDAEELKVKVGKKTMTVKFNEVLQDVEIEVGDQVEFPDPKNASKMLRGEVVSLDEDTQTAKVKVGAMTKTVDFDQLSIMREAD